MSDLITPFNNPAMPAPGLDGDLITARGTDPQVDTSAAGGSSALQSYYENPPVPTPDGQETANPVSGLPGRPARWQPSNQPPSPPDLTDRNPGTIDER